MIWFQINNEKILSIVTELSASCTIVAEYYCFTLSSLAVFLMCACMCVCVLVCVCFQLMMTGLTAGECLTYCAEYGQNSNHKRTYLVS